MSDEMKCARCGKELGITEFVRNPMQVKVLGCNHILRFCNSCLDIRIEGRE